MWSSRCNRTTPDMSLRHSNPRRWILYSGGTVSIRFCNERSIFRRIFSKAPRKNCWKTIEHFKKNSKRDVPTMPHSGLIAENNWSSCINIRTFMKRNIEDIQWQESLSCQTESLRSYGTRRTVHLCMNDLTFRNRNAVLVSFKARETLQSDSEAIERTVIDLISDAHRGWLQEHETHHPFQRDFWCMIMSHSGLKWRCNAEWLHVFSSCVLRRFYLFRIVENRITNCRKTKMRLYFFDQRNGFTPPRETDKPVFSLRADGTIEIPKLYGPGRDITGKLTPEELP